MHVGVAERQKVRSIKYRGESLLYLCTELPDWTAHVGEQGEISGSGYWCR